MEKTLFTPKGFRDISGNDEQRRIFILEKIKRVLELFGFEPLETPTIEFAQVLKGKYGEEEKLIYEFTDRGGRDLALRYDLTVPLARYVAATNQTLPFKRYQIGNVFRADNPQKGRFREFTQVDFDIVGASLPTGDAEIIATAISAADKLGFSNFVLRINDRETFQGLRGSIIATIDKLPKIGKEEVTIELQKQGLTLEQAKSLLEKIKKTKPSKNIISVFSVLEKLKVAKNKYIFDPFLARGLDYYTGTIFELEIEDYDGGSVGGGGRYDDLISKFTDSKIPAVGFSFGLDRLIEAAKQEKLFPDNFSATKIFITVFSENLLPNSLALVSKLRSQGIESQIALNSSENLEKQLKYVDSKGIPFAIILGPKEIQEGTFTLKDLKKKTQVTLSFEELIKKVK